MTVQIKHTAVLDIIIAVSNLEEKERLQSIINEKELPYRLHCPENLREIDELTNKYSISLIITDLEYQNGSLVDWLSLWPVPFILLACSKCVDKIDSILLDDASTFLLRREDLGHISFIPNMIKKVLAVHQNRSVQNDYIKATEKQYMNLVHALPDIIYVLDSDGHFTFINNAVRSLGWEPMELIGKHFSILLFEEDLSRVSRKHILPGLRGKVTGNDRAPKLFDERRTGPRMTRELRLKLKRKSTIGGAAEVLLTSYGEISSIGYSGFQNSTEHDFGTAGIIREHRNTRLNDTENAEKSIFSSAAALTHDEVMHLINNKLQVLSSLVSLKQGQHNNPASVKPLNEVQTQIYTLSLVYQNMVMIENSVQIKMNSYLDDIIKHLVSSYAGNPWVQNIELHCDSICLEEDPAITVSLLVSELIVIFLKIQDSLNIEAAPLAITFLKNNEIAQLKFKSSETIFSNLGEFDDNNETTVLIQTLIDILGGEFFLEKESITVFFNIT